MRNKLKLLAVDYVGIDELDAGKLSDVELIIIILEVLTDKVEKLDGHSHTIN